MARWHGDGTKRATRCRAIGLCPSSRRRALPTDRNDLPHSVCGVLGESGRVVGIVSRHLRNTNCVWMTPSDLIADQVPAATRRRMFG